MQSFRDDAGRDWIIRITYSEAARVLSVCGVDLLDFNALIQACAKWNVSLDMLWAIVEPQATKLGVTKDAFVGNLDGVLDKATKCVIDEIADFFERTGRQKAGATIKKLVAAGESAIEQIDFQMTDEMTDRLAQKIIGDVNAAIKSALG